MSKGEKSAPAVLIMKTKKEWWIMKRLNRLYRAVNGTITHQFSFESLLLHCAFQTSPLTPQTRRQFPAASCSLHISESLWSPQAVNWLQWSPVRRKCSISVEWKKEKALWEMRLKTKKNVNVNFTYFFSFCNNWRHFRMLIFGRNGQDSFGWVRTFFCSFISSMAIICFVFVLVVFFICYILDQF